MTVEKEKTMKEQPFPEKLKKETKVIIIDNNPLSISAYFAEHPEMVKRFVGGGKQ